MRNTAATLLTLALLSQACAATQVPVQGVQAAPCAALDDLSDEEISERLRYIEIQLRAAYGPTRAWFTTWLALLGAASVGQITMLAALPSRDLKIDAALGTVGTVVAIAPLALLPRGALTAADRFAAIDASMSPRARLCQAEALFESAAEDAAGGSSWLAHLSGDAAAIALGMVQWLVFHHDYPGAFTAVAGSVGNEFLVLTQPTSVVHGWRTYQAMFRRDTNAPTSHWSVDILPNHVAVRLSF